MKGYKQAIGKRGERLALQFLSRNSYRVVARNFSCCFGEIDIIARQGKTLVFIEVKTRSSVNFGLPEESIRPAKIKHLKRAAQFYIKVCACQEQEFRFDVVAIVLQEKPEIHLIKGAF
jgi:putative endonuclease